MHPKDDEDMMAEVPKPIEIISESVDMKHAPVEATTVPVQDMKMSKVENVKLEASADIKHANVEVANDSIVNLLETENIDQEIQLMVKGNYIPSFDFPPKPYFNQQMLNWVKNAGSFLSFTIPNSIC